MTLTLGERAFLDKTVRFELAAPRGKIASLARLAAERVTELQERNGELEALARSLEVERNMTARAYATSLCNRVPAFFRKLYARVMLWR